MLHDGVIALNNNKTKRALLGGSALALLGMATMPASAQTEGDRLIADRCLACHTETGNPQAPFSRISEQRKTPEGWMTTLNRMQRLRGLHLSAEEKRQIIKHLADTQGLAPSETAGKRYLLEQQPNVVDDSPAEYAEMCSRCHSGARFALQRRSQSEWENLVHFHMGQFPSLEFHALSRDRPWFELAVNDVVPQLSKDYGLANDAEWQKWLATDKPELDGRWVIAGFIPGKGAFDAVMRVTEQKADEYSLLVEGQYADGQPLSGGGKAVVYTGYEWRASLTLDGIKMRQVLAADASGKKMQGRQFNRAADELGGRLVAVKSGSSQILATSPSYIKQGESADIRLIGTNLTGKPKLGADLVLDKVLSRDARGMVIRVQAKAGAADGLRQVQVGTAATELAVYGALARVDVSPATSIARIGGNGGLQAKVQSNYRAIGYAAGPDGKAGTEDDLRLGYMPASWSLKPANEVAEHDNDLKYAGTIDRHGIFTPGDAGLNAERKMSTNNVGMLSVVGTVADGAEHVDGEASLLVTVQDFVQSVID